MMAPLTVRCRCGGVELEATGAPITSVVCYCNDCQQGAQQIEALPNARRVREPDGGVGYLPYRKDRVPDGKGAQQLKGFKLRTGSLTRRRVAMCCNSAVVLWFEDS